MLYLGVDLGGTNIKAALVNSEGEILCEANTPTNLPRPAEAVCDDIAALCLQLAEGKDVAGVGVGCPGTVDGGTVLYSNNLDWHDFAMEEYLAQKTGLPVAVGNDANVAALGEQWRGGGRGFDNIVMVTLGTGVGGGIIMNGKILTGENGAAGEIGHITVNPKETLTCGCGCKGCLEQYSSATGVIRLAKERLEASDKPSELRKFADDEIGGKEVFDAYKAGDELAAEAVDEFAAYLGMGLGNVASVVDTQAFVIGGGLSKNGPIVIELIKKQYEKNVMFALKNTEFRLAELGNDAGMYGAVRMVIQ